MKPVIEQIDTSSYGRMVDRARQYVYEDEHQLETLRATPAFSGVLLAKKYDDWFLDPIVGFVLPGFGDALSSLATLPALYVSLFKLRSIKLTLAILFCMLVDFLCGVVPVAGDIVDAFYKSNKKACRFIVGYVENDEETMAEINKLSTWGLVILAIVAALLWACYEIIAGLWNWIASLF